MPTRRPLTIRRDPTRARSGTRAVGLAAAAAAVVMVLDARHAAALDPARSVVGAVVGPVESASGGAVRPVRALGGLMHTNKDLRGDVATLQSQNTDLRSKLAERPVQRNRLAEYDRLTAASRSTGHLLVPAHVVGIGAAASFSKTVTIDAGSRSGIKADSTVVTGAGLVGRVLRTTRSTATVLLIADKESVVGGRLGTTMQIGFLRGRGVVGRAGKIDLHLVDGAVPPQVGDSVVTWGSGKRGPYVPGIPVGKVVAVTSNTRESSQDAVIEPYADLGALDLVGVVVPKGTKSDRALVRPGGLK